MTMSADNPAVRSITFIVTFSKDLPELEQEEERKEAPVTKQIYSCNENLFNSSDCESSKDFMRLFDYNTELLQKNAREIFSELCKNTKIGSLYEEESRTKSRHPLTEEFEKVAEQVFNEVLMSRDLEEQEENQINFMEMAQ